MNERTDEWKRVNHVQHAVWCFSQSAQSRKAASSIRRERRPELGFTGECKLSAQLLLMLIHASDTERRREQETGLITELPCSPHGCVRVRLTSRSR